MLARYLYRERVSLLFTRPATKYVSQQKIIVTVTAVFERENNDDKKKQIEYIAREKVKKTINMINPLEPLKKEKDPNIVRKITMQKEIIM